MNGDGDIDVLSASSSDDKIAWYENDGNENFTTHTITTGANSAWGVFAADVDGDGDMDVLSASFLDDKIAWYENDGSENFTAHTITAAADGARNVVTADIDGDGDLDVVSSSDNDDTIAWYENEAIAAGSIAGRHIFYNDSFFDKNTAGFSVSDDAAIDPVRSAYLPGAGNAVDANVTGFDHGINGIMIDIARGTNIAPITAADFVFKVGNDNSPSSWAAAPAPSAVQVRTGAGVSGSDRVDLIWTTGAIQTQWLEVQVLANSNTGLPDKFGGGIGDVFYFGNAVGDSGTGNSAFGTFVNATDEIGARNNPHGFGNPATVDDPFDYNKDRFVNATDQVIARNNPLPFLNRLRRINIGTGGPFAPQGDDDPAGDASGVASGGQSAAINGDAGIASALAAKSSASVSPSLPASTAARLASASPAAAAAIDTGLLLEAEDIGSDDLTDAASDLDDELLDALAIGIALG